MLATGVLERTCVYSTVTVYSHTAGAGYWCVREDLCSFLPADAEFPGRLVARLIKTREDGTCRGRSHCCIHQVPDPQRQTHTETRTSNSQLREQLPWRQLAGGMEENIRLNGAMTTYEQSIPAFTRTPTPLSINHNSLKSTSTLNTF